MWRLVLSSVLTAWLLCQPSMAQHPEYEVKSVHDGDTLRLSDGQLITLYGVDAPELNQPFGPKAREALANLVENKTVTMDCVGNHLERFTCIVFVDTTTDVSAALIEQGLAYNITLENGPYAQHEQAAKMDRIGVWSQFKGGIRPWIFRAQQQ